MQTEQEKFWRGAFGNDYIERNQGARLSASNQHLFSRVLSQAGPIESVIEFGANIGLNLIEIKRLLPLSEITAVEINKKAAGQLRKIPDLTVYEQSTLDFKVDRSWNFVFTKGLLIHLNPKMLERTYKILYNSSDRYICLVEYYNPKPVEINYRGHSGKLYKRDFAGEMLDLFPDLSLKSYGFVYHRDPHFPQDDLTWFLLEKARQ